MGGGDPDGDRRTRHSVGGREQSALMGRLRRPTRTGPSPMARLMMRATIVSASLVAIASLPATAAAQLPPLGEVFLAVERAAAEVELARVQPRADSALAVYLATARRAGLASADL